MRPSGDAAVRKAQLALSRVLYIQICVSHKHSQFILYQWDPEPRFGFTPRDVLKPQGAMVIRAWVLS